MMDMLDMEAFHAAREIAELKEINRKLLEACNLWLGAIQNDLGLRLALTNLPEGAGPILVEILQEAIAAAEPEGEQ